MHGRVFQDHPAQPRGPAGPRAPGPDADAGGGRPRAQPGGGAGGVDQMAPKLHCWRLKDEKLLDEPFEYSPLPDLPSRVRMNRIAMIPPQSLSMQAQILAPNVKHGPKLILGDEKGYALKAAVEIAVAERGARRYSTNVPGRQMRCGDPFDARSDPDTIFMVYWDIGGIGG